jgi:hypothetical protein
MGCKVGEKILHWESSKDTLDQMAIEIQGYLCNKRNRPLGYFKNEVKKLISKGAFTTAESQYLKCECLNKSEVVGICKMGACIEIHTNGWKVSINVE